MGTWGVWNLRTEEDIPVWGCDETIERGGALRTACALKVDGVKTKGFLTIFGVAYCGKAPLCFFWLRFSMRDMLVLKYFLQFFQFIFHYLYAIIEIDEKYFLYLLKEDC